MLLTQSLLALALQVGPNQSTIPPTDLHQEMRDREPSPSTAEEMDDPSSLWLAQCLALLEEDAARAHTMAQLQRNATSGAERVLANHCLGLAATELGLWDDAVTAFTAARDETPADEARARARFGMMAGNAALGGYDVPASETLLRQAMLDAQASGSAPLQSIAASDLARALVSMGRPEDALAELEQATSLAPDNPESWLLKATLLRRLERYEAAQPAIERAGELAPTNPAVGLEAGVIALFAGREDAARASWQSVIDLAPESPEADTAQNYLDQIAERDPQQ